MGDDIPKALPSGQGDDEISLKNAEVAFGPGGRTIGWYRHAAWLAEKIQRSGTLPEQIDSPEKAFAILCKGDALGLGPEASWGFIYITKAKRLAIMSKGALAVVQSKATFGGYSERIEGEGKEMKAVAMAQRKGFPVTIKEFSYADAETAGLLEKRRNFKGQEYDSTYQSYLKDMLLSRARARALDIAFAAELGGIPVEGVAEDIDVMEERKSGRLPTGTHEAKPPLALPPGKPDPLIEELSKGHREEPKLLPDSAVKLVGKTPEVQAVIDKQVDEMFPAVKAIDPGGPCPRCKAKRNAMNGCDVCGWPGAEDFRE